jgi:hypothetical protein
MGGGEPGDSRPIINEWDRAWVAPGQVRVVPEPKHGIFSNFSYLNPTYT